MFSVYPSFHCLPSQVLLVERFSVHASSVDISLPLRCTSGVQIHQTCGMSISLTPFNPPPSLYDGRTDLPQRGRHSHTCTSTSQVSHVLLLAIIKTMM